MHTCIHTRTHAHTNAHTRTHTCTHERTHSQTHNIFMIDTRLVVTRKRQSALSDYIFNLAKRCVLSYQMSQPPRHIAHKLLWGRDKRLSYPSLPPNSNTRRQEDQEVITAHCAHHALRAPLAEGKGGDYGTVGESELWGSWPPASHTHTHTHLTGP